MIEGAFSSTPTEKLLANLGFENCYLGPLDP
jgi:hypothetical protein